MLRIATVLGIAASLAVPASASASQLVDRNAKGVRIQVDSASRALLTYKKNGRTRRVLAWGAINAIAPTTARRQVEFRLDYSGGGRTWRTFKNTCRPYSGPALHWFVTGCTARDGSHWAVQAWQRGLPNYGVPVSPARAAWELRLSHWRGELPKLTVKLDWAYSLRLDHMYGTYTYLGHPIFGFGTTATGVPTDTFGRLLWVDTYNSAYGRGWKRENSFVFQNPYGNFCYSFGRHGNRPSGKGERYRATAGGPGVMPDLYWESAAPGPFNAALDAIANAEQLAIVGGKGKCRPH